MISLSESATAGDIEVSVVGDSAVGEDGTVAGWALSVGVGSGGCGAPTAVAPGVGFKLTTPTLTQINAISIITADNKFVKINMLNKKRAYAAIAYLWGGDIFW
jgi:hypothetical protein